VWPGEVAKVQKLLLSLDRKRSLISCLDVASSGSFPASLTPSQTEARIGAPTAREPTRRPRLASVAVSAATVALGALYLWRATIGVSSPTPPPRCQDKRGRNFRRKGGTWSKAVREWLPGSWAPS
jgi:hypothetical protein